MKKLMQQTSYYSRTDGLPICIDCVYYPNCPYISGTALPISCGFYVWKNSEKNIKINSGAEILSG